MLSRLLHDRQFYVAAAAGLVVLLIMYILYQPQSSWQRIVDNSGLLLLLCLVYPVVEELAFRGALQGRLSHSFSGKVGVSGLSAANIITSCLFVVAHLFYHPPLWALLVFVPSLLFGWFRDRYQSVVPGILLHILYNSGYFLLFLT